MTSQAHAREQLIAPHALFVPHVTVQLPLPRQSMLPHADGPSQVMTHGWPPQVMLPQALLPKQLTVH